MVPPLKLLALALSGVLLGNAALSAAAEPSSAVAVGEPPAWVVEHAAPTEATPKLVLSDRQIGPAEGGHVTYHRRVMRVDTAGDRESAGLLRIVFEPPRETATLHHVRVTRDGVVADRTTQVIFDTARREAALESGSVDGDHTAFAHLNDIAVGDLVDVAWSVHRRDVLGVGDLLARSTLHPRQPVGLRRWRVTWPATDPLRWRIEGAGSELAEPHLSEAGDMSILELSQEEVAPAHREKNVPNWLWPDGLIEVSTVDDWGVVVEEVLESYAPQALPSELAALVDAIGTAHEDPARRVTEAFRLVQARIRYVSIAVGRGGWIPRPPQTVWRRGWGDCKDKAMLLISILHRLGIEADAALVHTQDGPQLDRYLPSPFAFNHVIVRVREPGDAGHYFIDPTDMAQGGVGRDIAVMDFAWALPIAAGVEGLVPVPRASGSQTHESVLETFSFLDDGRVTLDVLTTHRGRSADALRRWIEDDGREAVASSYTNYYADNYRGLSMRTPMAIEDDLDANKLVVREAYELDAEAMLEANPNGWLHMRSYSLTRAMPELEGDGLARRWPVALNHPTRARHEARVMNPPKALHPIWRQHIKTDWFVVERYGTGGGEAGRMLSVIWEIETLTPEVPAAMAGDYVEARALADNFDTVSYIVFGAETDVELEIAGIDLWTAAAGGFGAFLTLIACFGARYGAQRCEHQ